MSGTCTNRDPPVCLHTHICYLLSLRVYFLLRWCWWYRIHLSMQETWDAGSIPGSGRCPGGGNGNRLQYSCLENPHGQRNLVGFSPWGRKALDMTEVTVCVGLVPGGLLFRSCRCVCVSSLYEGPANTDDHCLYPSTRHMQSLDLVNVRQLHQGIMALFAL